MRIAVARRVLCAALAGILLGVCAACTPLDDASNQGSGGVVAFLLPESQTARYEAFDRPLFEAKFAQLCPDCTVIYANANQDSAAQQSQAESALAQGVDVLVLDPVDSVSAASIVASATAQGVPVLAYDRFIEDAPLAYYISFDNTQVGKLQAQSLLEKMTADGHADGSIVMINGSPTDGNAAQFKSGAHAVIDASGLAVLAQFDTPAWLPSNAQDWMAGQVVQYGPRIQGVYAANDGTAGGAIAAMKAAGIDPLPPVTGQDAELAGIQRIVAGDQYMTVYKAIRQEAELAAQVAYDLLIGEVPVGQVETDGIPTTLLTPIAVTIHNIVQTVVDDGFYTIEQICTPEYADACAAAGIR